MTLGSVAYNLHGQQRVVIFAVLVVLFLTVTLVGVLGYQCYFFGVAFDVISVDIVSIDSLSWLTQTFVLAMSLATLIGPLSLLLFFDLL